jgi:hypothetical protein
MRILLSTFLLALAFVSVVAQKSSEWQRAYTFEDSAIEMNTTNVIWGGDIGRVTFRWVFDQPEELSRGSNLRYKSRLETIEFRCADKFYRMYEVSFLDSSGKTIYSEMMKSPYEWRRLRSDGPMATMFAAACRLINAKLNPSIKLNAKSTDEIESERLSKFALNVKQTLDGSRDFQAVIHRFFAPNFVRAYLEDDDRNWFYNLNREIAARAGRADLEKFYTALLNADYLTWVYLISQAPAADEGRSEVPADARVVPPDIYQLINNHPYTRTYKTSSNYDFLAENVDSMARMRSYTDLLEKIAGQMRKHVTRVGAERSATYQEMLNESGSTSHLCSNSYLGLPKGTKIFEVLLPPLRLEIAEIHGELKIVSARDSSQ